VRPSLPHRPRLAAHAQVRRHVVDGRELIVVHDGLRGGLVHMGPHEWDLLAGADGTRDLDALVLAAAARGALRRVSEIVALLEAFDKAGLLADGIVPPPLPEVSASDPARPLDVLPRFSLTCDASGACCSMYSSVAFTSQEAARARSLCPEVLGGGEQEERVFTPALAAAEKGSLFVALVDGRCAYLDPGGRCSLHRLGGATAKPRGCQVYPATFVDDGEHIRVSVGVECPCVLASAGVEGGAPLVDPEARTRADLVPGTHVAVLPEGIALTSVVEADRAAFVGWSRLVVGLLPDEGGVGEEDFAAILWSLAEAIERAGLDRAASKHAVATASQPAVEAMAPWIEALAKRSRGRVAAAESWRSPRDRSRAASAWIAATVEGLCDPGALGAALAAAGRFRRDEALAVRAMIHGHTLVRERPLATALRDRAVRFVVARALPEAMPGDDSARAHPLVVVEAMMRAHGLGAYVEGVAGTR
jgi:lysine-N-methylase